MVQDQRCAVQDSREYCRPHIELGDINSRQVKYCKIWIICNHTKWESHEYRDPFWSQQPHCIHEKVALCKTKVNLLSLNVEAEIRHCLSLIVSKLLTWAKNRQRLLIKYIQELEKSIYGFVSFKSSRWHCCQEKFNYSWVAIKACSSQWCATIL